MGKVFQVINGCHCTANGSALLISYTYSAAPSLVGAVALHRKFSEVFFFSHFSGVVRIAKFL